MIIGITGKIGSGKSTVAKFFRKKGFKIINVDKIGHKLLEPDMPTYKLLQRFLPILFDSESSQLKSRHEIAKIIFTNRNILQTYNNIIHPYLTYAVVKIIEQKLSENLVIDAALLFQLNLHNKCNKIIYVCTKKDVARKRISHPLFDKIWNNQKNIDKSAELADFIIENNSTIEDLYNKVEKSIYPLL